MFICVLHYSTGAPLGDDDVTFRYMLSSVSSCKMRATCQLWLAAVNALFFISKENGILRNHPVPFASKLSHHPSLGQLI